MAQERSTKGTVTLEQRVARLGMPGNDNVADVKELASNPRVSSGILIRDLHPIPDSEEFAKADKPPMEHVLWLIRALRYITGGMDFCAPSKHVFGKSEEEQNRKYWLTFAHHQCLTFFSLWPSRGRWYIAPEDTQKSIIAQWRHWYATSGAKFEYKPLQNPPPEKWLWW
ncbi:MAG: hypothetical protein ACRD19_10310 [Terriglobia bacterium]